MKRARKLIRFSATGVVEKVVLTMRKKEKGREVVKRHSLCSGVDTTEGSNEGRKKEGRKEEHRQRTGGYCESRALAREVSEVARISHLSYRRRDGPDTSGRERRRRRRNVADAP